ncbi:Ring finger domain-containing protein isoform 2 [Cladophialophora immunda]|nr:Ring finger domain-containing protein isoform 2 [Cladophialophora immunda]
MYIPRQQFLTEADVWPQSAENILQSNGSVAAYPGMPADLQPPYRNNPDIHSIAVFIQITWMLWFVLILLMMCRALYDRFGGAGDEGSDAESDITEAGWRIEDSSLSATSAASQHRKRLKKLEQVAPAQSLLHWRAEKSVEHVQTFATLSTTLSCAICLESLEETDLIRELRCGHVYHANCLNLWVERGHHDCPLCKYDMLGLMKSFLKPHPDDDAEVTAPGQEVGQPSEDVHSDHVTDYGTTANDSNH